MVAGKNQKSALVTDIGYQARGISEKRNMRSQRKSEDREVREDERGNR